jgi:hypothetical protein
MKVILLTLIILIIGSSLVYAELIHKSGKNIIPYSSSGLIKKKSILNVIPVGENYIIDESDNYLVDELGNKLLS